MAGTGLCPSHEEDEVAEHAWPQLISPCMQVRGIAYHTISRHTARAAQPAETAQQASCAFMSPDYGGES